MKNKREGFPKEQKGLRKGDICDPGGQEGGQKRTHYRDESKGGNILEKSAGKGIKNPKTPGNVRSVTHQQNKDRRKQTVASER